MKQIKHKITLLCILFGIGFPFLFLSLKTAPETVTIPHLYKMVEAINSNDFELATKEMPHIASWYFAEEDPRSYLDMNQARLFVQSLEVASIDKSLRDSLFIYVSQEAEMYFNYFYSKSKYKDAFDAILYTTELRRAALGTQNELYVSAYINLCLMYRKTGDYEKAELHYLEAIKLAEQTYGKNHPYYAMVINNMGIYYLELAKYNKAEECYRKALEIQKEIYGDCHPDYAVALLNLGNFYLKTAKYKQAESCFMDVLKITRAAFGDLHEEVAKAYNNLGSLYTSTYDYVKAELYFTKALRIRKELFGDGHPYYAESLFNIGVFYHKIDNYAQAEQAYLLALEIHKKAYGEEHIDDYNIYIALGSIYKAQEQYAAAEQHYKKALELQKKLLSEEHPNYALGLYNLGALYAAQDDYAKAEQCYIQALDIQKKISGEKHDSYANTLGRLATFYISIGDYAQARQYSQKAADIFKIVFNENHVDCSYYINLAGWACFKMGDYAQAEQYYHEAQRVYSLVKSHEKENLATLGNLGLLYTKIGDFTRAEENQLKALEVAKKLDQQNPDYAMVFNNIGVFYHEIGNIAKAEKYYREAFEISSPILPEQHPNLILFMHNLGEVYCDLGEYAKTETYYTREQEIYRKKYLQSIDYLSEKQRTLYWKSIQESYEKYFPIFVYRYYPSKHQVAAFAYNNELFTKGLLLHSSENIKRSITESNDTALIRQWQLLNAKKQQIQAWEEKDPQAQYLDFLYAEAEKMEKQILASSSSFRQNYMQKEITWKDVRSHLKKNQVAIEFFTVPLNEDSTMYCALLLRQDSKYPELISLFKETEALSLINTTTSNNIDSTYAYEKNGRALSELVWKKLLPRIRIGETIYFAVSGLLHQLAIEALPLDNTQTVAEQYTLIRLSSTREIAFNKESKRLMKAALYGGIQYNMETEELMAESELYAPLNLVNSRSTISNMITKIPSVRYLPGTKKEVELINKLLISDSLQVQLYKAEQANEESFKALSGTHQNILHIATHGFFWSDTTASVSQQNPLNRCGLLMAGANISLSGHGDDLPESVQDGIMTAKEISFLDLRDADLVVLSACETGKGEVTSEGVFGLQRAFKQAGAQTIIMSLWPVDDAATQLLMTEFYTNWIYKHQSKREAFTNAQNFVRSQYNQPVYWAGFVMLD